MLTTRPLTPEDLPAWLDFFDHRAFADNPDWSTCYCRAFLVGRGADWDDLCARRLNREPMAAAITEGSVEGTLAWDEGKVVGWLHYGPAGRFTIPTGTLFPKEDARVDTAGIVCFAIDPAQRGRGIARALLRGALEDLATRGYQTVVARAAPEGLDSAQAFTGPLALFLSEGFVAEPSEEPRRVRVRRALGEGFGGRRV